MIRRRHVLIAAIAAAAEPARAAQTWRIVTEYPATAMPGEGIAHFAAAVAQHSGGMLTIQPGYDAPDGVRSASMFAAVLDGRVDAADAFTGALATQAAIFQLSALPFLTASAADTARLLQAARPAYQQVLTAHGLSLLYATPWPATGLWSRMAVPDAAALQGLRVRTYDAASTAVFAAAGAKPVQISFADAMGQVRAGGLDAVLSSGDGGAGARLWDSLPHFTLLDYASPLSLAFCNAAALAALPAPLRSAVAQAADATEARQFQSIITRLAENDARMRANGVQIAHAPAVRDALAKAAGPVIADWTARTAPEGATILTAYRG